MTAHKPKNTPWLKQSSTKKDRGETYSNPSEETKRRGAIRKEIEDKQLEKELFDDPLFGG